MVELDSCASTPTEAVMCPQTGEDLSTSDRDLSGLLWGEDIFPPELGDPGPAAVAGHRGDKLHEQFLTQSVDRPEFLGSARSPRAHDGDRQEVARRPNPRCST